MFLSLKTLLVYISVFYVIGYKYKFKNKKAIGCFGESDTVKNCFSFIFSTRLTKSYILESTKYPRCFNASKSSTFKYIPIRIGQSLHEYFITGDYAMDTFILPEQGIKIKNFTFVVLNSGIKFTSYCGIIGLSKKNSENEKEFDFLQALINNKYISDINLIINKNFIAIDDNEIKGKKVGYTEKNLKFENLFHVNSNGVMIYDGKKKYFYNTDRENAMYFKIDAKKSYIPFSFFQVFVNKYFTIKDENEALVCKGLSNKEKSIISCAKNYQKYYDFSSCFIYIFINNWSIRVNMGELFELDKDSGRFHFLFEYNDKNRYKWFLGTEILDKYQIEINKMSGNSFFSLYHE